MQLKTFLKIFSLVLFCGCIRPNKPVVDAYVLDGPAREAIKGKTGSVQSERLPMDPLLEKDKPLDKSVCFPVDSWKEEKNYIDKLNNYADYLEAKCNSK